jgi:hypothetical protein
VVLLSKLGLEQQRASQRVDDQLGAHVVGDRPSDDSPIGHVWHGRAGDLRPVRWGSPDRVRRSGEGPMTERTYPVACSPPVGQSGRDRPTRRGNRGEQPQPLPLAALTIGAHAAGVSVLPIELAECVDNATYSDGAQRRTLETVHELA